MLQLNKYLLRAVKSEVTKIGISLIIIGAALFTNAVVLTFIANFNLSIIIVLILSLLFIIYGANFKKLYKIKYLNIGIISACGLFIIMCSFLAAYGNMNNVTYTEDAVIVLGSGIRGETVTKTLAARLDKAAEYYRENRGAIIIVSGGMGPQESITEAEAMKKYLLNIIPDAIITEENKSRSTLENLTFSKQIADAYFKRPYKAVIITNDFHIYRAALTAKRLGLNASHLGAKTELHQIFLNYSRECLAVLWSLINN